MIKSLPLTALPNPLNVLPNLPDLIPDLSDLSRASSSWLATLGVGLAIGLPASTAAADPLETEANPRPVWTRWLDPNAERPPIGESVYYKKGAGLEYRQELKLGGTPVELGFSGPLMRTRKDPSPLADPVTGRQKRMTGVGLTVEVRF